MNSDEAAVMGAAFKAAGISPSFRVKEIRASDVAVHAVGLSWAPDGKEKQQKLFPPSSQVGVEKHLPFKTAQDFTFDLYQQAIDHSDLIRNVPVLKAQTQNLTASVKELMDKFGCLVSDISTKFSVRLSPINGLPEVIKGSVSCEVADLGKKGSVVNDVKGFFGFGSKKGDQTPLSDDVDGDFALDDDDLTSSTTKPMSEKPTSEPKASTAKNDDKLKEVKKKTETILIGFSTESIGLPQISPTEIRRIKDRMSSFDASDRSRRLREEALNTLEGYTYRVRDIVEDEGFIGASTEKERAEIEAKGRSASDWLYGEGADASRETLKARLKEIRDLVDQIQKRKDEATKRPKEVLLLKEALEQTKTLIGVVKEQSEKASLAAASASAASESSASAASAESSTQSPSSSLFPDDDFADLDDFPTTSTPEMPEPSTPPIYTPEDLTTLTDAYSSVQTWLDEKLAAQEKLSPTDDPVIFSEDLAKRSQELNKVVMNLLQKKMKIPAYTKPKSSGKTKTSKSKTSKSTKGGKKSTTTSETTTVSTTESVGEEEPAPTAGSQEDYYEEKEGEGEGAERIKDEL